MSGESVGFSYRFGGRLFPRRRAVDRAAMRPDGDYLWKLALRRKVAGNVLVVCGHGTKLFAGAFMGIENDDDKGRTFARPCTALPRLSGRLATHQGVRRVLYQILPSEKRGQILKIPTAILAIFATPFFSRKCLDTM